MINILNFVRSLFTLIGTVSGVTLAYHMADSQYYKDNPILGEDPETKLAIVLGMFGFLLASMIAREIELYIINFFKKLNLYDTITGTAGFLIGLLAANLLILLPAIIFLSSYSNDIFPDYIKAIVPVMKLIMPFIVNLLFGYIGATVFMRYQYEIIRLISGKNVNIANNDKYMDTSVLIDGRIYDIVKSKFIDGRLAIPEFVIQEMQFIADSQDMLKRSKGRRGLDILNKMQNEFPNVIEIIQEDVTTNSRAVDEKLVALAKKNNARLLTTDYNLNKVAQIHGIEVLNINDLANALKPIVMPGETMNLHVIKEGKDSAQGVGYLPDGTMVIVEDGHDCIGKTIDVVVTSMLQTAAGRLVFTRTKAGFDNVPNDENQSARSENSNEKKLDSKKDKNDGKIVRLKK